LSRPQPSEAVWERRLGVLGSKFRTRLVVGGLLLSFLPVIMMFWFAYGLMNNSIERWFSRPVEEVREDTAAVASLVKKYAAQNARAEAEAIAAARKRNGPLPVIAFPA
jgi:nitrogen fixation/metabolism regulation signal transduction histidine kinase